MADFSGDYVTVTAGAETVNLVYNGIYSANTAEGTTTYLQRVFSSGLNAWCYYNGVEDSSPVASTTTPNWTGAITAYERLGRTS